MGRIVPMKKIYSLFLYILFASALIQLLLILYKDYTGYDPLESLVQFLSAWIIGSVFSAIIVLPMVIIDLRFIRWLDSRFNWMTQRWQRIWIEILLAMVLGALLGVFTTVLSHLIFVYEEPLRGVFFYNALIGAVINLLLMTIAEAVLIFKRQQEIQLQAEELKRENIAMRFETLKKQLDPHFLFNSLNVLSHLVRRDRDKAQDFIDEFSAIYRYTLEVIDKPVVSVQEELDFARSYLYLQQLRFGDSTRAEIHVNDDALEHLIPPLAVQTLLENVFKHNIATPEKPLVINISNDENRLIVRNNLQFKAESLESSGMGFENLKSRYRLFTDETPEVILTEREYIVHLPLLEAE
ncbi:hypothetical protein GF406_06515 [candidate division KSB1 bacterium]|nr:hypothetical protein [candidate division KSB1 bacterium]